MIYCQAILVRNVVAGIHSVDQAVLEAARGMGLSQWRAPSSGRVAPGRASDSGWRTQCGYLHHLESPLWPLSSTPAAWARWTREGIGQDYGDKIIAGVIAVTVIAIFTEQGLRALVRVSQRYRQGQTV